MSDADRARAYSSEYLLRDQLEVPAVTLHGTTITIPVERKFADLPDVQRYVDKVLALNWVLAEYPQAAQPLTVVRSRVINEASCGGGTLYVNPDHTRWALRESVILHEVAHHLAPYDAHGVYFRMCFLALLEGIIGAEAAFLLRCNYMDNQLSVYAVR